MEDACRWRETDAGAEELTGECGIGIVAGPIGVFFGMLLIRCEVMGGGLDIVTIKWANGKEGADLDRYFEAGGM